MWFVCAVAAGVFFPLYVARVESLLREFGPGFGKFLMASRRGSACFLLAAPFLDWSSPKTLWLLYAGAAYAASALFYYRIFGRLSGLTVAISGQMMPVMVLLGGIWLLRELLTQHQTAAVLLVMVGSMVAAIDRKSRKDSAAAFASYMAALVFSASGQLAVKHAASAVHFVQVPIFMRLGYLLGSEVVLRVPAGGRRMRTLDALPRGARWQFYATDIVFFAFSTLSFVAIALQPAQLNAGLVSVTYFGAGQAALFVRAALRKESGVWRKALGAALAIGGLLLLASG